LFRTEERSVIETGDDAAAVEVSLIENVAREDADELTCFETYVALAAAVAKDSAWCPGWMRFPVTGR